MYEVKTKTPQRAREALMRLASKSEKSSGDAMKLLRRWGVEREEAEKILAELEEAKFIDDERFASAYAREKLNIGGWGEHKIRAAMAARGIAREVADAALAENADKEEQAGRLERLLEKRKPKVKAQTRYELRAKLTRYAMAQGFEYDAIVAAAEKILKGDD